MLIIIYSFQNDIGEEMFFIRQGRVNILGPKNEVVAVLGKGQYFGDIALFIKGCKRISSVVAGSFCRLYSLRRSDLDVLANKCPLFNKYMEEESKKRLAQFRRDSDPKKIAEQEKEKEMNKPKQTYFNQINFDKIKDLVTNSHTENSFILNAYNHELVDEDELFMKKEKKTKKIKKVSRRFLMNREKKERRYSRISIGDEFALTNDLILKLQWGLASQEQNT